MNLVQVSSRDNPQAQNRGHSGAEGAAEEALARRQVDGRLRPGTATSIGSAALLESPALPSLGTASPAAPAESLSLEEAPLGQEPTRGAEVATSSGGVAASWPGREPQTPPPLLRRPGWAEDGRLGSLSRQELPKGRLQLARAPGSSTAQSLCPMKTTVMHLKRPASFSSRCKRCKPAVSACLEELEKGRANSCPIGPIRPPWGPHCTGEQVVRSPSRLFAWRQTWQSRALARPCSPSLLPTGPKLGHSGSSWW